MFRPGQEAKLTVLIVAIPKGTQTGAATTSARAAASPESRNTYQAYKKLPCKRLKIGILGIGCVQIPINSFKAPICNSVPRACSYYICIPCVRL